MSYNNTAKDMVKELCEVIQHGFSQIMCNPSFIFHWKLEGIESVFIKRDNHPGSRHDKNFNTMQKSMDTRTCIYCHKAGHKPTDCETVENLSERRHMLCLKQLCFFNCARKGHRTSQCSSRRCFKSGGRHHTSIYDRASACNHHSPNYH